ncbi:MAG TPA: rRNA maturation RNase YbeY [Azospirillaceae bacterium]|nr:rRNA maturation RNase YbeY [Azospirillaceae bacterium]
MTGQVEIDVGRDAGGWDALEDPEGLAERAARAAVAGAVRAGAAHRIPPEGAEMSVTLSDDESVRVLNRDYRGKDKPTNVLSFALADETEESVTSGAGFPILLGDVVLAFETVDREAREQGKALSDHVAHLVVHGVLHLLGFTHDEEDEASRMEALETAVLATLGIADPYAAGAAHTPEER